MTLSQMKYYKQLYGYSYDKIAELSGVPKGTIQKIFTGVTKYPRQKTLQAIEKALAPAHPYPPLDEALPGKVSEPAISYGEKKGGYTLEDYYAIPDERRVELIDGVIYDMGAPTSAHQIIAFQICYQIQLYIDANGGDCMPFIAPVDVQLDRDEYTMLQPDVFIICDKTKDINRCIYGAPDFVVEVLSKSTRKKDMRIKTAKYANAGVKEYWMIDPYKEQIIVYLFGETKDGNATDEIHLYGFQDQVPINIYDGKLKIDFPKIKSLLSRVERQE